MYDIDAGCSLKGSTPFNNSVVGSFPHLHHSSYDFRELFQIWGNLCGGNGVSVLLYAYPELFKVFKHLIYV
jgi:hypothetical protein